MWYLLGLLYVCLSSLPYLSSSVLVGRAVQLWLRHDTDTQVCPGEKKLLPCPQEYSSLITTLRHDWLLICSIPTSLCLWLVKYHSNVFGTPCLPFIFVAPLGHDNLGAHQTMPYLYLLVWLCLFLTPGDWLQHVSTLSVYATSYYLKTKKFFSFCGGREACSLEIRKCLLGTIGILCANLMLPMSS